PARFVSLSAAPSSRSIATCRYRDWGKLGRCSPALGGPGFWWRGFVGQFNNHEPGGKFLGSVEVEVDGGAFGVECWSRPSGTNEEGWTHEYQNQPHLQPRRSRPAAV